MLVNQGFAISKFKDKINWKGSKDNNQKIELKDINSDEDSNPKRKYCPNNFSCIYMDVFN